MVLGSLEGQLDVDEGGERLHGPAVLRVLEEVAYAGLEVGVPVDDVELGVQKGLDVCVLALNRPFSKGELEACGREREGRSARYLFLLEGLFTPLRHRQVDVCKTVKEEKT